MIEQPFDIFTAMSNDNWRKNPAWPLPLRNTAEIISAIIARLDMLSREMPEPDGPTVSLASISIVSAAGALVDAAMNIEAGLTRGIRFIGSEPAIQWLSNVTDIPSDTNVGYSKILSVPNFAPLRRIVRTAKINRFTNLLRGLASPNHIAISHNHLMDDVARRGTRSIGFKHASVFLATARHQQGTQETNVKALVKCVVAEIMTLVPLGGAIRPRLQVVIEQAIRKHIIEASRDIEGFKKIRTLPKSIWVATNGFYPARAMALEVRRRGGKVTVFDHGGPHGLLELSALRAIEFCAADNFVSMTLRKSELIRKSNAVTALPPSARPDIVAHDGDPTFVRNANSTSRRRTKPKILFPLGPFYGFRQWYPPILPDPIYYDFLLRLVPELTALPLELILKPRPSVGRHHPLENLAKVDYRKFEQVLPDADVLLFDDVHSTTFWQALCSDRSIVHLDLGYNRFTPEIDALIKTRVRTVPTHYSSKNIPRWDPKALQDALLKTAAPINPAPFQLLLAKSALPSDALSL